MRVSCIIPAFNEEATIRHVLRAAKKVRTIDEIVVVDDGSSDHTYAYARAERVKVAQHARNRGKGAAIKTGVSSASGDILLFLDADLRNITPKKISAILQPLRNDEADFVKTTFGLSRGRVTELVVKPLLRVICPFVRFKQPISGQFALKRSLIEDLKIDDAWGVDIQILLQLIKKGVRIKEVDIGFLLHKKQPLKSKILMSEQVMKTILAELGIIANKHKLVIFDFDKTLIRERSIEVIAKVFGFEKRFQALRSECDSGRIKDCEVAMALARLLEGKTEADFKKVVRSINLRRTSIGVVDQLKRKQYQVGIISLAFSPVVHHFAKKMGISKENVICPQLAKGSDGRFTGRIAQRTKFQARCCDRIICKAYAARTLMKRLSVKPEECIAVGDGGSDECLFRACGFSLSYRSENPFGDIKILSLAEVLINVE